MEDKNTIKLTNEKGEEVVCDILFTFDSEETNKSYIVYTDNELDKDDMIKTYASIYEENGKELKLTPIEDEKEWKIIETILQTIQEEVSNKPSE